MKATIRLSVTYEVTLSVGEVVADALADLDFPCAEDDLPEEIQAPFRLAFQEVSEAGDGTVLIDDVAVRDDDE